MTEETPVITPDVPNEPQLSASLGSRLRTAREQMGLDVEDVSRQLCLSPRQVAALESDAFDTLPSPTFARGFIRNYAKLLQLDAESLLALYRGKAPETSTAAISLHSEGIPIQTGNRSTWLPYLIASILVVIGGTGWWLYMDWRDNHPAPGPDASKVEKAAPLPAQQSSGETQSEPPPMGAGMQPEQLVQPAAPVAQAPVSPVPATPSVAAPAQPATPVQSSAPAPMPAAAQSRIVMRFAEPSWIRVLDGDGKELINKNKPASSEETIEGKPPFKVEIGNVSGAVVTYNGQPVDLAIHAKANVARLTLE